MDMQDRIVYDPDEIIRILENELDKLKIFRFDSRYRSLLGENFIRLLGKWEKDILNRKDDPFTLVVCGEFKRGKSSLINALLGEDVVPVNVTAETVTLNRITYGAHSNEALLSKGKRMQLLDTELERENLEKLMQQSDRPFCQVEIRRPIDFLKKVDIVDTPGLGDSMQDFSELVDEAICQADAVLYVFSVRYPLSQTEQLFLKTMILPQKYTELMLVGNYLDTLNGRDEYERMDRLLCSRIQKLLPGQSPWMVSALDERCRQLKEERPNPRMEKELQEHFERFRQELNRLAEEKKDSVLPDRMQRMFRGMLSELSENLDALEEGLHMSSQDVKEAMQEIQHQKERQIQTQEETGRRIDEAIGRMKEEGKEWMGGLLERMRREVTALSDVPAEELSKYYTFYCIDTIQEGLDRCLEYHTLLLFDMLEEISSSLTAKLSKKNMNSSYGFRFTLDNRTWTKGDNISYIVSKINGFALVSLVADGVAGSMRQKEMSMKTPDILRSIEKQYVVLRSSVEDTIDKIYDQMSDNAKKQLAEYYKEKLQAVQVQAEQSAMVARQDEEKKEEIRQAAVQIREILEEIRTRLEDMV